MNFKWDDHIPPSLQSLLLTSVAKMIGSMITQGVSNTIYGFGLMEFKWEEDQLPVEFTSSISKACVSAFSSKNPQDASQSIANVVYALGLSNAKWDQLPPAMTRALCRGIECWANEMTSQELCITVYG